MENLSFKSLVEHVVNESALTGSLLLGTYSTYARLYRNAIQTRIQELQSDLKEYHRFRKSPETGLSETNAFYSIPTSRTPSTKRISNPRQNLTFPQIVKLANKELEKTLETTLEKMVLRRGISNNIQRQEILKRFHDVLLSKLDEFTTKNEGDWKTKIQSVSFVTHKGFLQRLERYMDQIVQNIFIALRDEYMTKDTTDLQPSSTSTSEPSYSTIDSDVPATSVDVSTPVGQTPGPKSSVKTKPSISALEAQTQLKPVVSSIVSELVGNRNPIMSQMLKHIAGLQMKDLSTQIPKILHTYVQTQKVTESLFSGVQRAIGMHPEQRFERQFNKTVQDITTLYRKYRSQVSDYSVLPPQIATNMTQLDQYLGVLKMVSRVETSFDLATWSQTPHNQFWLYMIAKYFQKFSVKSSQHPDQITNDIIEWIIHWDNNIIKEGLETANVDPQATQATQMFIQKLQSLITNLSLSVNNAKITNPQMVEQLQNVRNLARFLKNFRFN